MSIGGRHDNDNVPLAVAVPIAREFLRNIVPEDV